MKRSLLWIFVFLNSVGGLWAHQPVMDMAPRWQGGYGFQIRQENTRSDTLRQGDSEVSDAGDVKKEVDTTWLEGIYTFERWIRLSLKIPWINQRQTLIENGNEIKKSGKGLGDVIVGLLLKRYKNEESSTGNIAFTPSLRLPTGSTAGDLPVSDGSLDLSLSFSKSLESELFYQYYDLFYWINGEGKDGYQEGNELGLDINIGLHPYHDNLTNTGIFVMLDVSARSQEKGTSINGTTGGDRINTGPVFVYYQDNIMFRTDISFPIYEKVDGTQFSSGRKLNVGIGMTF